MQAKTSIRYYNQHAVRSRYDENSNRWYTAAVDFVAALEISSNPRIYWAQFKRRNPQVLSLCKQLKLTAADSKAYQTDCLSEEGLNFIVAIIPAKYRLQMKDWIKGQNDPIDAKSKAKAIELWENRILDDIPNEGKTNSLQQIHSYIFGGLYEFAGQIRKFNISKKGFLFASALCLNETLKAIDDMPDQTIDEIFDKYVEMNIAHPFMEGNGRATRIWLDLLLKRRCAVCVDWSKISKEDYLKAMEKSPVDSKDIKELLLNALTSDIHNREIFMKGIDYSYYYETVDA